MVDLFLNLYCSYRSLVSKDFSGSNTTVHFSSCKLEENMKLLPLNFPNLSWLSPSPICFIASGEVSSHSDTMGIDLLEEKNTIHIGKKFCLRVWRLRWISTDYYHQIMCKQKMHVISPHSLSPVGNCIKICNYEQSISINKLVPLCLCTPN